MAEDEIKFPGEIVLPGEVPAAPEIAPPPPLSAGTPAKPTPKTAAPVGDNAFTPLITQLNVVVNQLSMYQPDHPVIQEMLAATYAMLAGHLTRLHELTIGIVEGKLFVEEQLMDEANKHVARFTAVFKRLGIDSLSFREGIEEKELALVCQVMGTRPETLQEQGGVRALIRTASAPHVKCERSRYQRVTDGQVVVEVQDGEKVVKVAEDAKVETIAGAAAPQEGFLGVITKFLQGDDAIRPEDEERLVREIRKHPRQVALLMVQIGRAMRNMQSVVERIGQWMADWTSREGYKMKFDVSEVLGAIGRELQKELLESSDLKEAADSLGVIVSQYIESIKVSAITARYKSARNRSPEAMQDFAKKFIESKAEKERILPKLEQQLREAGVASKEVKEIVERLRATPAPDEVVEVSRAELERLVALERQAASAGSAAAPGAPKGAAGAPLTEAAAAQPAAEVSAEELAMIREKANRFDTVLTERVRKATERLTTQNQQLSSELERVESLLHELAKGVIVIDNADRVLLMNRAAEELLGVPRDEMIGRPIHERIRDEHLVALARKTPTRSEAGVLKQVEMASKQSSTRETLKASSAVVEDEAGRTVGMVFVLSDVTREKELEALKTAFLNRVTGALRSPLVSLRDTVALLNSGAPGAFNEEQARLIGMASENLRILGAAVEQLLDLSSLKQGGVLLNRRPASAKELVEDAVKPFGQWCQERQIRLKVEPIAETLSLLIDRERIGGVLSDVVAHAIRWCVKEGAVTISAQPRPGEPAATIRVHYTGRLMSKADQAQVFEPFAEVTGAAQVRGATFGLAVAREIVRLHDGAIDFQTLQDGSYQFVLVLPLAPAT